MKSQLDRQNSAKHYRFVSPEKGLHMMKKLEKGMKAKIDRFRARAVGGKDHIDLTIKQVNGSIMADLDTSKLKKQKIAPNSAISSQMQSRRRSSSFASKDVDKEQQPKAQSKSSMKSIRLEDDHNISEGSFIISNKNQQSPGPNSSHHQLLRQKSIQSSSNPAKGILKNKTLLNVSPANFDQSQESLFGGEGRDRSVSELQIKRYKRVRIEGQQRPGFADLSMYDKSQLPDENSSDKRQEIAEQQNEDDGGGDQLQIKYLTAHSQPRQPRASIFVHQPSTKTVYSPDRVVRALEFSPNFDPDKLDKELNELQEKLEARKQLQLLICKSQEVIDETPINQPETPVKTKDQVTKQTIKIPKRLSLSPFNTNYQLPQLPNVSSEYSQIGSKVDVTPSQNHKVKQVRVANTKLQEAFQAEMDFKRVQALDEQQKHDEAIGKLKKRTRELIYLLKHELTSIINEMFSKGISLGQVFYQECDKIIINFDLNILTEERKMHPDFEKQVKLYSVICLAQESKGGVANQIERINEQLIKSSKKPSDSPRLMQQPLGLQRKQFKDELSETQSSQEN
ncbi:hypothetical protein FGO68_gene5581 [Halteria grandinella]|uniref:Uncharacterized protein n=1 Tax=Halteria grandinella TaxID=5974 RepID=A0A8J8P360_HALGN|nr:hypothetical protein FGO68_gene5581 [Halteria grandinella]